MSFDAITIVCIDGRAGEHDGAQAAIARSQRELPGAHGLLLCPERPARLRDGIEHQPIQPLGYLEYGLFAVYALQALVRTEFALIVQQDGWVLSGAAWRPEYFHHDYIGAPAHLARVVRGGTATVVRHYAWLPALADPACRVEPVLNGGFSLRSRRLMQAPTRAGAAFVIPPVAGLQGPQWTMGWHTDSHLEDVQLCLDMRPALLAQGVRYAPLELARTFAFEHLAPGLHDGLDLGTVLGHHSRLRRIDADDPPSLSYTQTRGQMAGAYHDEGRVVALLRQRGWRVTGFD